MVAIPPADYLDFIWPDMYLTIAMVVAMVGCVIFAMYNAKHVDELEAARESTNAQMQDKVACENMQSVPTSGHDPQVELDVLFAGLDNFDTPKVDTSAEKVDGSEFQLSQLSPVAKEAAAEDEDEDFDQVTKENQLQRMGAIGTSIRVVVVIWVILWITWLVSTKVHCEGHATCTHVWCVQINTDSVVEEILRQYGFSFGEYSVWRIEVSALII